MSEPKILRAVCVSAGARKEKPFVHFDDERRPRIYGLVNPDLAEVFREALQKTPFMYPNASGLLGQFKETIANFENEKRGVKYEAEKIIPTTGVASALYLIQSAVLKPGDEVALLSPNHFFFGPADQVEFLSGSFEASRPLRKTDGFPDRKT